MRSSMRAFRGDGAGQAPSSVHLMSCHFHSSPDTSFTANSYRQAINGNLLAIRMFSSPSSTFFCPRSRSHPKYHWYRYRQHDQEKDETESDVSRTVSNETDDGRAKERGGFIGESKKGKKCGFVALSSGFRFHPCILVSITEKTYRWDELSVHSSGIAIERSIQLDVGLQRRIPCGSRIYLPARTKPKLRTFPPPSSDPQKAEANPTTHTLARPVQRIPAQAVA